MNSDNRDPPTRPNISLKEIELVPLTFDDPANFEEHYIGYLDNVHEFCKIFFQTISRSLWANIIQHSQKMYNLQWIRFLSFARKIPRSSHFGLADNFYFNSAIYQREKQISYAFKKTSYKSKKNLGSSMGWIFLKIYNIVIIYLNILYNKMCSLYHWKLHFV